MLTPMTSSSTVTMPLPLQSPGQNGGQFSRHGPMLPGSTATASGKASCSRMTIGGDGLPSASKWIQRTLPFGPGPMPLGPDRQLQVGKVKIAVGVDRQTLGIAGRIGRPSSGGVRTRRTYRPLGIELGDHPGHHAGDVPVAVARPRDAGRGRDVRRVDDERLGLHGVSHRRAQRVDLPATARGIGRRSDTAARSAPPRHGRRTRWGARW